MKRITVTTAQWVVYPPGPSGKELPPGSTLEVDEATAKRWREAGALVPDDTLAKKAAADTKADLAELAELRRERSSFARSMAEEADARRALQAEVGELRQRTAVLEAQLASVEIERDALQKELAKLKAAPPAADPPAPPAAPPAPDAGDTPSDSGSASKKPKK